MAARPTTERLRELFRYEPDTGRIIRLVSTKNRVNAPGDIAGTPNADGYLVIWVDGALYYAHLLAWALHHGEWPTAVVDHDDRDRQNNRIGNLFCDGYSGNNRNVPSVGCAGFRGVRPIPPQNIRYWAGIKINGKKIYLGSFDTAEEAARAYDAAVLQHCGPRFPTNASLGLLQ